MNNVTRKELARVIGDKTLSSFNSTDLANAVAGYLLEQNHQSKIDFDSLMRDVMQYRLEKGLVEVTAVSAHELGEGSMRSIDELLKERFPNASSIVINRKIDTNIVGGVRLDFPMESLDLSIRSKLNTFKDLVVKERN